MNKHTKTVFSVVIIFIVIGYFTSNAANKKITVSSKSNKSACTSKKQQKSKISSKENQTSPKKVGTNTKLKSVAPVNWETYTNKKYRFTFQYSSTWIKSGEESYTINRMGDTMTMSINFIDTLSQSSFFLEYHLAPYGAELYQYAQAQIDSTKGLNVPIAKQRIIAGSKAIESTSTMSSDIKGNIYDPALRFVRVIFLDKQKTGEFNLFLKTPLPNSETEIAKYNHLLSTFKVLN